MLTQQAPPNPAAAADRIAQEAARQARRPTTPGRRSGSAQAFHALMLRLGYDERLADASGARADEDLITIATLSWLAAASS